MGTPTAATKGPFRGLITAVVLIVLGQAAFVLAVYFSFQTWEVRNQFASVFAATGSLFTGLALVGVIYGIMVQRRELEHSSEKIELTQRGLLQAIAAQEESSRLSASATLLAMYADMAAYLEKTNDGSRQNTTSTIEVHQHRRTLIHDLETRLGLPLTDLGSDPMAAERPQ